MLRPGKDKGLATPIPLGLAALATTTFIIGVAVIARPESWAPYLIQALLFGGLVELLAGMWAFAYGDALAATTYSFLGAFFAWWGLIQLPALGAHAAAAAAASTGMATILVVTGVVVLYLWIASFNESAAFNLVLLFLWIALGLMGIGIFAGMFALTVLGGISALISGLIGAYASFAEVYNAAALQEVLAVGEPRTMRERTERDEAERIQRIHPANGMQHSTQMHA